MDGATHVAAFDAGDQQICCTATLESHCAIYRDRYRASCRAVERKVPRNGSMVQTKHK